MNWLSRAMVAQGGAASESDFEYTAKNSAGLRRGGAQSWQVWSVIDAAFCGDLPHRGTPGYGNGAGGWRRGLCLRQGFLPDHRRRVRSQQQPGVAGTRRDLRERRIRAQRPERCRAKPTSPTAPTRSATCSTSTPRRSERARRRCASWPSCSATRRRWGFAIATMNCLRLRGRRTSPCWTGGSAN